MEITPDIEYIFDSDLDKIASVELTYQNGGKVAGSVNSVRKRGLKVVIQKSRVEPGERPKHRVVFDHLTQLKVTFHDGSSKTFG